MSEQTLSFKTLEGLTGFTPVTPAIKFESEDYNAGDLFWWVNLKTQAARLLDYSGDVVIETSVPKGADLEGRALWDALETAEDSEMDDERGEYEYSQELKSVFNGNR